MGSRDDRRTLRSGCAAAWSVFEASGQPAHILSGQGLIVEANAAFERLYRAPRRRFVGRHQAALSDAPDTTSRRLAQRILRAAAAAGSWQGTLTNRRSDGWRFTTRAHVYPTRVGGRRYFVCLQERLRERTALCGSGEGAPPRGIAASPG